MRMEYPKLKKVWAVAASSGMDMTQAKVKDTVQLLNDRMAERVLEQAKQAQEEVAISFHRIS